MTELLSDKLVQERAAKIRGKKNNLALSYADKSALYGETIAPVKKAKRTRKKAAYVGHITRHPRMVVGKDTPQCKVLTLNPCKEYQGSGFIEQWGYCEETNILKVTIGKYKYLYFHVTPKDMKKAENYKKFHYFYNQEIKGRKEALKV